MSERDKGIDLTSDPEIARGVAIFSHAKFEAEKLIPGKDPESLRKRIDLQSQLTRDLLERSGLGVKNGEPETNKEVPAAEKPSV